MVLSGIQQSTSPLHFRFLGNDVNERGTGFVRPSEGLTPYAIQPIMPQMKKRILTGDRPTESFHLVKMMDIFSNDTMTTIKVAV